jgi:hypothetical protein
LLSDPVINIFGKKPLSADSIRFKDSTTNQTMMFFYNDVQVTYYGENETMEYLKANGLPMKPGPQRSIFNFRSNTPIVVLENGLYFQPLNILAEGYWGFEKLAELLPSDYVLN